MGETRRTSIANSAGALWFSMTVCSYKAQVTARMSPMLMYVDHGVIVLIDLTYVVTSAILFIPLGINVNSSKKIVQTKKLACSPTYSSTIAS